MENDYDDALNVFANNCKLEDVQTPQYAAVNLGHELKAASRLLSYVLADELSAGGDESDRQVLLILTSGRLHPRGIVRVRQMVCETAVVQFCASAKDGAAQRLTMPSQMAQPTDCSSYRVRCLL
jgi:hypothetical protein